MAGIALTQETVTTERLTYTASAPDTSQMTAVVENGIAVFTVGGMTLNISADAAPALAALVATVAAQRPVAIASAPSADTTSDPASTTEEATAIATVPPTDSTTTTTGSAS